MFNISAAFLPCNISDHPFSATVHNRHCELPEDYFPSLLPLLWGSSGVTRVSSSRLIVMFSVASNIIEFTCPFYPIKMPWESYLISLNAVCSSFKKIIQFHSVERIKRENIYKTINTLPRKWYASSRWE